VGATARPTEPREPGDGEGLGASRTLGARARSVVERADRAQQRHRWSAIAVAVVRKFSDDRAGRHAALIAYYAFFSLFPLLLVLVTILGFLIQGDPDLQRRVLDSTLAQFPIIGQQIRSNVRALTGSFAVLAIGLGGAIWSGLAVISAVQDGMDEVWNVARRDRPSFVRAKLRALAALGVLGVAVMAAALLAGLGASGGWLGPALRVLAFAGTVALNVGVFAAMFRLLTDVEVRWRDVLPGAALAGVVWVGMLVIGSWLVDRQVREASHLYGFFAIVIGLLGWIYLGAQMALLAAELNVVLKRRLWPRSLLERAETTEPDRRVLAGEVEEEVARRDERVDVRFGGDPPNARGS
jgi:YihY family inner membrane protein